jgi:sortase A
VTGETDLDSAVREPTVPSSDEISRRQPKLSRWDRPAEPHDWRWVVGHIGRAMITVGLLMFGFVAYQLWGTGIQTARAQNHLDHEFDQFIEEQGITVDTLGPTTTTTIGVTVLPVSTTPSTLLPEPVEQDYGDVDSGDGLARLKIPKIGVDYIVVAGVSVQDLRDGPGHFPNTPLPGQYGNSAIAGHRTTFGAPFYDLDHLQPGDEIQVFTKLGGAYVYVVTDSIVVNPTDYHVITDSDPTKATITLVTCTPIRTAKQRLVVHGTLDASRSNEIGKPLINYGQSTPIPIDTVLPGDETVPPTEPSASGATAVAGSAVATTVPDTAPAAVADTPDEFAATDAFSQGWFGDSAAWPHVVFWCALLALVWYGSYRLAKRLRRLWLGIVVGFVPFVVVLYFFYENVNRLLPPAL